jgi:pimeloyl-ACP methyl ester carboxylesterase
MTDALTLDLVTTRTVDELDIRVADSGQTRAATLLMTSPWPESLLAYRKIWATLEPLARLVAIDLPGFGHSPGRRELLTPPAMAEFLKTLIDEWDLGRPHVLAPDVGTSAALFLAARHPDSVTSVIVGSGGVAYPLQVTGTLADLVGLEDVDVLRAADIPGTIGVTVEPAAPRSEESEVWHDYVSAYEVGRFAESARYVHSYPEALAELSTLLPGVATPALVINTTRDPLVPAGNGEYLHERLRRSHLVTIDTSGHFAWELEAAQYGQHVADWIAGGDAEAAGRD